MGDERSGRDDRAHARRRVDRGGTHGLANDHGLLICVPGQDVSKGCEIKRPSN